ncbi:tRNA (guanosine(37)-N1)-methyltransferase TrmD [Candidatus Woesebacteria bacterium]|nr:tRNA (guanosine(37)-N1)-methyltransferase TrmD [Candidatus Woesebacteria bacterium]QQG47015.1 MAG: tRNA (guanosine(37)-N1)-methyltransferase TrmD [Candidatus Woesebacteria bacterium]
MKIDIVTLFPEMFKGPFDYSIMDRAIKNNLAKIEIHDLRKYGIGERRTVDDRPYSGGVGMILRVDVVVKAINEIKSKNSKVILLSAGGKKFTQQKASEYSKLENLILICGHYEGFDERILEYVDEEITVGDYVLTGGEIPSMVITDAVVRLIPGAIPKEDATKFESFTKRDLVEYPQYTRPEEFEGLKVPGVLLSGNHSEIEKWKEIKAIVKTKKNRPDLIKKVE